MSGKHFLLALLVAALSAGCEQGPATETVAATAQPDLLTYSPEWCVKRQADIAAGRLPPPESPAQKLKDDGICSATMRTSDQPVR